MELRIITPEKVVRREDVCRIVAEASDGVFGILPRHMDHVTQLVAGVPVYETDEGAEHFVGVNAGTLVKTGPTVMVAVRAAIEGDDCTSARPGRSRVPAPHRRGARGALCACAARGAYGPPVPRVAGGGSVTQDPDDESETITRKAARMQEARKRRRESPWFGLGMFGLVGWAVAVPIIVGIALGRWIDARWPGDTSWTLALLLAGAVLGALNAWYWMQREGRDD